MLLCFFFSSRRRHTRWNCDWSSDVCSSDLAPKAKTKPEQVREDRRQHRVDRYNEVVGLSRKGMSQQEISRTLHLERKTIRRFLRAGQFPERASPHRRPPGVNKFQEFLRRRWAEGCHNATKL